MYSLALSGLSISTNLFKSPRLTLGTSHKAAPTVSLSNTHVERDNTADSLVPFPSAPIRCPGTRSFDEDVEMAEADGEEYSPPRSGDWHLILHRKHARSCLATSFVHRNGHALPRPSGYESDSGQHAPRGGVPVRKRKLAHKRAKAPSPTSSAPPRKRSRKAGKRQAADLQFTATVHRSLVAHLRVLTAHALAHCADAAAEDALALRTQDRLLVERLWKGLMDHGFKPVAFPPLLPAADTDPFILSPERVDHVFQSEPLYIQGLPTPPASPGSSLFPPLAPIAVSPSKVSHDLDDASLPTPPATPPPAEAPLLASSPGDMASLPTPPATPPPAEAPVLAMSQLVASLILRHRERSTSRPRSACSAGVRAERGRSPLATYVLAPSRSCASA